MSDDKRPDDDRSVPPEPDREGLDDAAPGAAVIRPSEAPIPTIEIRTADTPPAAADRADSSGDRAESLGDRAESLGDRAESLGDRAESLGDRAKSRSIREEAVDLTASVPSRPTVPTGLTTASPAAPTEGVRPVNGTRRTSRLAMSLWSIAIVLGLAAAFLGFHPGAPAPSKNRAFADTGATTELMSQASQRVCAPFRYQYDKLDEFLANARSAMTGEARKNFDDYMGTNRKIIDQTKAGADCQAEYVGISDLDGDHAVVVASLVVSTSRAGAVADSGTPRARYIFEKVAGQWLISQVEDV